MAFLGKTYTLVSQENFDTWLKATGVPDDKIALTLSYKPVQKFDKNGDTYTITQTTSTGLKPTNFKSGVEFDDTIGESNTPVKTTYTVDGNTITQVIKSDLGTATFKREFNGDDLVVSITSDTYDGVAKRFYKA